MHYYPTLEDDSGEYYVQPRPPGDPGPPLFVKRPHPPRESIPLPEDFDAYTQGGGTTTAQGPASEWAARVRDSGVNTVPLDDDFDAMTWTATNGGGTRRNSRFYPANGATSTPMSEQRYTQQGSYRGTNGRGSALRREMTASTSGSISQNQNRGERRRPANVTRTPSLVDLANIPTEPYAPSSPPLSPQTPNDIQILIDAASTCTALRRTNASTTRRRPSEAPPSPSRSLYRSQSSKAPTSSRLAGQRTRSLQPRSQTYHSILPPSIVSPITPATTSVHRPPIPHHHSAGLEYKLVDQRVIEDGPERTVTISKWREDLDARTAPDVEMSVYYVNPEEYYVPEPHQEISMVEEREKERQRVKELTPTRMMRGPTDTEGSSQPALTRQRQHSRMGSQLSSSNLAARFRASSDPVNSTRTKTSILGPSQTHRSHSPTRHPPTSRPRRSHAPNHDTQRPIYESSPRIAKRSSSPFHATLSGLTITTIKRPSSPPYTARPPPTDHLPPDRSQVPSSSASHTPKGPRRTLAEILATCRPSLSHLIPILQELGISSEGHLIALARLSEETRNREVRRQALKRGVKIVEWAILCDFLKMYR